MIIIMLSDESWDKIMELLGEIEAKIGPYKIDQTEHAWSVMENSTENALLIKKILRGGIIEKIPSSAETMTQGVEK